MKRTANYKIYPLKKKGILTIILLYVEGLLIIGEDKEEVNWIKLELMMTFEMIDLDEVIIYLGTEIPRTEQGI